MFIYIVLINILFSITFGENITLKHITIYTTKPPGTRSKTEVRIQTEGGTVVTNTTNSNLHKSNETVLLSLDKEFPIIKKKPVKGRKGAFPSSNDTSENFSVLEMVSNNTKQQSNNTNVINGSDVNISRPFIKSKFIDIVNTTSASVHENKKIAVTEHLKKPTILSYEALANMDKGKLVDETNLQMQLPISKPSKSVITDQMPSPNNENFFNKKSYHTMNDSYPGLVTPLVISILVVPVFAVLGYMALKRGKEAWKNRHYKRVDFLLDGMYND